MAFDERRAAKCCTLHLDGPLRLRSAVKLVSAPCGDRRQALGCRTASSKGDGPDVFAARGKERTFPKPLWAIMCRVGVGALALRMGGVKMVCCALDEVAACRAHMSARLPVRPTILAHCPPACPSVAQFMRTARPQPRRLPTDVLPRLFARLLTRLPSRPLEPARLLACPPARPHPCSPTCKHTRGR